MTKPVFYGGVNGFRRGYRNRISEPWCRPTKKATKHKINDNNTVALAA